MVLRNVVRSVSCPSLPSVYHELAEEHRCLRVLFTHRHQRWKLSGRGRRLALMATMC